MVDPFAEDEFQRRLRELEGIRRKLGLGPSQADTLTFGERVGLLLDDERKGTERLGQLVANALLAERPFLAGSKVALADRLLNVADEDLVRALQAYLAKRKGGKSQLP